MKGRDPTDGSDKDERLIIFIRRASLEAFLSRKPGAVRGNLTIMSRMQMMDSKDISLEDCFPPMRNYPLKDKVGMVLACVNLRISLLK